MCVRICVRVFMYLLLGQSFVFIVQHRDQLLSNEFLYSLWGVLLIFFTFKTVLELLYVLFSFVFFIVENITCYNAASV